MAKYHTAPGSRQMRNRTTTAAFIELEGGLDGNDIHVRTFRTRKINHPSESSRRATNKVEAVVWKSTHPTKRIWLSAIPTAWRGSLEANIDQFLQAAT